MLTKILSKKFSYALVAVAVLLSIGATCDSVKDSTAPESSSDWLIPVDEVYDGGPGRDGIPALSNPNFDTATNISYLSDDDLVIGFKVGDEVRAYPHPILDWHEIINDAVNGVRVSITYCPLTGSGIAWDSKLNGTETTFGVSGLLYNTNLIPYDRATNSNWSQMKLQCVSGPLKGDFIETFPVVETSWKTWQELYPNSKVVNTNTGFSRNYGDYPYGNYRTNGRLIFPVSHDDSRLSRKERVLGVIVSEKAKAYRFTSFNNDVQVINDNFEGLNIVVTGSQSKNFMVAYDRTLADGRILSFSPVQNELPVIMVDNEGTKWNIFGEAIEGPRRGARLNSTRSFIAYWFAWGTFYPGIEINAG